MFCRSNAAMMPPDVVGHHNGALFAAARLAEGDVTLKGQSQTRSHFVAVSVEACKAFCFVQPAQL
jgi:hypothetical protein